MRAIFCAPPSVGLQGDCGGVLREMQLREESLRALGHEIEYLQAWRSPDWSAFDLCHLFMANGDSFNLGEIAKRHVPLVVSPIIDRVQPNPVLRASTWLDWFLPGTFTHIGRCARLCDMADMVCLRSREEEWRMRLGLGVKRAAVVVPCPIERKEVVPQGEKFGCWHEKPYALFIGDAGNPRKNVKRLIQAVRSLDVELLVGGTISDTETGRQVRRCAETASNVRLIGVLSEGEKAYLVARAKVFALPSLMEGIGLAAMEAALAGTTVVVTANGGASDYLGRHAYYVNPLSVCDIRSKIQSAFRAPMDASTHLQESFSVQVTGRALEACYRRCIESCSEERMHIRRRTMDDAHVATARGAFWTYSRGFARK